MYQNGSVSTFVSSFGHKYLPLIYMKNYVTWLCCILLIAGCATTAGYNQVLNTWLGSPERNLISSWGIPDSVYEISATKKIISYFRSNTVYTPGVAPSYRTTVNYQSATVYPYNAQPQTTYFGSNATTTPYGGRPATVTNYSCRTDFTIRNNTIINWRWEGNSCRA